MTDKSASEDSTSKESTPEVVESNMPASSSLPNHYHLSTMIWRESSLQHFPGMIKILAILSRNLEGTVNLCSAHPLMPIVQMQKK